MSLKILNERNFNPHKINNKVAIFQRERHVLHVNDMAPGGIDIMSLLLRAISKICVSLFSESRSNPLLYSDLREALVSSSFFVWQLVREENPLDSRRVNYYTHYT